MMNNSNPDYASNSGIGSISDFASSVLETYQSPVAKDRVESMAFMTVGSGRLRLINEVTSSIARFLRIGQATPPLGCFMEVVLGEYGAGKSHIGYAIRHNVMNSDAEVLVAHVQITGNHRFNEVAAEILSSLRISKLPSESAAGIELSAYRQLIQWIGGGAEFFEEFMRRNLGRVNAEVATQFREALESFTDTGSGAAVQQFIETWVAHAQTPQVALEVMNVIFRMFHMVQVSRVVIIVDEFEAMRTLSDAEIYQNLQFLQQFHDMYASTLSQVPGVYVSFLSTIDWFDRAKAMLPSLLEEGNRVRRVRGIPNITKLELIGLTERYMTLLMMRNPSATAVGAEAFLDAVNAGWDEIVAEGKTYHMRTVHKRARAIAERLVGVQ